MDKQILNPNQNFSEASQLVLLAKKRVETESKKELLKHLKSNYQVENGFLILDRSSNFKLKTPVKIPIQNVLKAKEKGVADYIISSLIKIRPKLIPYIFENESLIELARYLKRYRTGSPSTLYGYVGNIQRYCEWLNLTPDQLIKDLNGNTKKIQTHIRMLEDFLGMLQDQGLSPNPIANYAKAIRTFYRIHRITIQLSYPLTRKVVYSDRAPTPEEIAKILEVANIREKVVISLLALGGFREGTLVRLKYKHLSQDLEKGITPVQVMVPAEITKGKYAEYWTFIGAEAVEYLKLYLEARREGLTNNHPPEKIGPETPIIRHTKSFEPKPITEKQLRVMVHNLLIKAGIINKNQKPKTTIPS